VAKRKTKHKVTPIEAQRRRLDALQSWFEFVNDERAITPQNFGNELLGPTTWGLDQMGGYGLTISGDPAEAEREVKNVKMEIAKGLKMLADNDEWVILGQNLGHFNIVISQIGTSFEGELRPLALLGISGLLHGEEWRPGHCAWCGKLFLKKKRGEYCNPKCSQRMRTLKVRNKNRWKGLLREAKKAAVPIATYLLMQRKKPGRHVTTCPACKHEFEVREIPMSVQCPSHKGYFVAGPLNTKSVEVK
jgi:hypothetical protein